VIVLGRHGEDVLLVPNSERHMLPWMEIPRWQRVAENLTAAVKNDWGEEVVCLFELATEPLSGRGVSSYEALEHLSACGNPKMPTRWVPLSTLCEDSLTDAQDYAVIKQVVTVCNKEIGGASAGPFVRLGWLGELRNWIQSVIEPMGFHVNGEFRQLNASASFSLIRFATNGPALWFKAVGEPNQREFAITSTLARFFPDYLPTVLASRRDWNGWLTREVQGKLLHEVQERRAWEGAAVALARLQIQSISRSAQILEAGARDLGSVALSKRIEPFIGVMAQLMERQIKTPPPVLRCKDFSVLTDSLHSSLEVMEATGIPETLGHLDLNPGNVITSENRTAFLDWAEAYIGNPLFTLEYLLQHARRAFGGDSTIEARLTQVYCAQWGGVVSPTSITRALDFAPLLAVFAYAVGSDLWKQEPELQNSTTAGYLRSLARRMHREAKELADRRALCLQ
jgi:hypothetical protein